MCAYAQTDQIRNVWIIFCRDGGKTSCNLFWFVHSIIQEPSECANRICLANAILVLIAYA